MHPDSLLCTPCVPLQLGDIGNLNFCKMALHFTVLNTESMRGEVGTIN